MLDFVWDVKKFGKPEAKVLFMKEKSFDWERIGTFCSESEIKMLKKAVDNRSFKIEAGKSLKLDNGETIYLLSVVKHKVSSYEMQVAAAKVASALKKVKTAAVFLPEGLEKTASDVALGMELELYSFDKYFTTKKEEDFCQLEQVFLWAEAGEINKKSMAEVAALANGVRYGRDLCNEPGNVLTPLSMAEDIKRLSYLGIEVEIIPADKLEEKGFSLLYAVGKGSANPPCVAVMTWKGNPASKDIDVALVGKGITFDTGGINLKNEPNLIGMKHDMTGAAVAASTLKVLALQKQKINATAVLVMAENMPDGKAYKPEDVYTSASGLTVEVINTDAEGRMGLADGLWYASAKLKAKRVIDIATLTGAVVMALGHEFAGLFCDDDKMADDLLKAGLDSGERLWRLPMCEEFGKLLKSDVADVKHLAARGHGAGSATAAMFLKKFVKGKTPWAHLDIAGRDDSSTPRPLEPKGATAFGIRLLCNYLKNLKK